jgi:hypothetical protein
MKKIIYIEHGDIIINVNKKCFFTIFTEWKQLFSKHNWYSFTPIHVFYENDSMLFGHLFQITLFGFGINFRYNTDKAMKLFKKWEKETKHLWKKSKKVTKKVASKKSKSK